MFGLPDDLPQHTLGWGVIKWMTKYLKQPDGPRAGQEFQPTDAQARFLLWYYAVDGIGRFIYRRATWRSAKGVGKSPFGAAVAVVELLGPVRFSHFDDKTGLPIGKAVAMPHVILAAATESQTANTYSMVAAMLPIGSRARAEYALDIGKTQIFVPSTVGKIQSVTSSAHALEGQRLTAAILDETEWLTQSNGGIALDEVIRRNLAKVGGRLLTTENAFVPGIGSVAETIHDSVNDQRDENYKGPQDILHYAVAAPADTDIDDLDSLRAGLAVAYQDAPWIDIDRIMAEFADTKKSVAHRFYLNWITAGEESWVSPQEWNALKDVSTPLVDGDHVGLFFDGSRVDGGSPNRDSTSLTAVRLGDGYISQLGLWEPSKGIDTAVGAVDACVAKAFERFDVIAFFADVREWEQYVHVTWPDRYGDRLLVKSDPNAKINTPIAWDMRRKELEVARATELAEAEIVGREFRHDGHPGLAQHVYNAQRRPGLKGDAIGKETPNSPRKIDAAVTMIGARMVRRICLNDKEYQRKLRRGSRGPAKLIVMR